jgi:hypothetical protein
VGECDGDVGGGEGGAVTTADKEGDVAWVGVLDSWWDSRGRFGYVQIKRSNRGCGRFGRCGVRPKDSAASRGLGWRVVMVGGWVIWSVENEGSRMGMTALDLITLFGLVVYS